MNQKALQSVDCALITALPNELDKLLFHFRHSETKHSANARTYYTTTSPSGLSLVGAACSGMGQLNAAALARDVIDLYRPKSLILVGIAGGLDRDIPLGDVVASDQIIDYELGKVTAQGVNIRWSAYPPDQKLVNLARGFRNDSWKQYIATTRPTNSHETPSFHIGLYLSGNKVIADEETAGALKGFWTRAAAIEMEAAGVAAILRQMEDAPGFIVIKGICDYADSRKNNLWQAYAADAAASFAYSFVTEKLAPKDFVSPNVIRANLPETDSRALRIILKNLFNISELKQLCHDLNIDWEELKGENKSDRIIDLIGHTRRHSKLPELIALVNHERDGAPDAFFEPSAAFPIATP